MFYIKQRNKTYYVHIDHFCNSLLKWLRILYRMRWGDNTKSVSISIVGPRIAEGTVFCLYIHLLADA